MSNSSAVIAVAFRYEWVRHAVFVMPLRAHYDGDIILFTEPPDKMHPDIRELGRRQRVTFLPLRHKCVDQNLGRATDPSAADLQECGPSWMMKVRFTLYAEQCRRYSLCLAVDFRDVIFQADPFATLAHLIEANANAPPGRRPSFWGPAYVGGKQPGQEPADLMLACEDARARPVRSTFNKLWLIRCCGYKFYKLVAMTNCILNSGSILGTPAGFDRLAEIMLTPCLDTNMTHGSDQAKLMWGFYGQQFGNLSVTTERRGMGVINTMRYAPHVTEKYTRVLPMDEVQWPKRMPFTVYNDDNRTVSAMIHQYDISDQRADESSVHPRIKLMAEYAALEWFDACMRRGNDTAEALGPGSSLSAMVSQYSREHRRYAGTLRNTYSSQRDRTQHVRRYGCDV